MDPKSILNLLCQQEKISFPIYNIGNPEGPSHSPIFRYGKITVGSYETIINNGEYKRSKELEKALAAKIIPCIKSQCSESKHNSEPISTNILYIIDYDHNGHLKSKLINYNCVIFAGVSFDDNALPKATNTLKVIKATSHGKDMVDHMITWWACENRTKLIKYDKVIVVSKDTGLSSVVHIMKENQIIAEYASNM